MEEHSSCDQEGEQYTPSVVEGNERLLPDLDLSEDDDEESQHGPFFTKYDAITNGEECTGGTVGDSFVVDPADDGLCIVGR